MGPWRYLVSLVRPGPLQFDMFLLAKGSSRDRVFWGTRSQPIVRFMFETLHDQAWHTQSIANVLYDQIILKAERFLGPEIYHILSSQFNDAIGRLVVRESLFGLCLWFLTWRQTDSLLL